MDIKKPNLSMLVEKLSFLRNNLALLAPICVALVAGLVFIPTELLSANLKKRMQTESISKARELTQLRQTVLSKASIDERRRSQQAYIDDANAVVDLSQQCGRRALLSYNIFPEPKDTSSLIFEQFGRNFTEGVDEMVGQANATECPTEAELGEKGGRGRGHRRQNEQEQMMMEEMMYGGGYGGMGQGYQMGATNAMSEIEDAICLQKVQDASLYVSYEDISGYDFWMEYTFDGDTDFAIEDCWYWQLGYWIIEDVFTTARTCNLGSSTVLTSPVKRIRRVSFDKRSGGMYGGYGGGYGGAYGAYGGYGGESSRSSQRSGSNREASLPRYVKEKKDALATPCTDRFGNEAFDIIHFSVSVVVRADFVIDFMKELCSAKEHRFYGFDGQGAEEIFKHNQITILESKILPVVRADGTHRLYRYGEDAVVELDLICEYLIDKQGYEPILPTVVKASLEEGQE